MTTVEHTSELAAFVGEELGVSAWRTLNYDDFVTFGDVSGDSHWIHTDRERARRESPFGDVVAQGFLTLSLVTALSGECFKIRHRGHTLNYGLDHVRFTSPVKPADNVRLRAKLADLSHPKLGANRLKISCVLEIEGTPKPAFVADWLIMIYDPK